MGVFTEKHCSEVKIQVNDISPALRNSIWNDIYQTIENSSYLAPYLHKNYFHLPVDEFSKHSFLKGLKNLVYDGNWKDIYILLEAIAEYLSSEGNGIPQSIEGIMAVGTAYNSFVNRINISLEAFNSGYRFVGKDIIEITNEDEISEIKKALQNNPYDVVRVHMAKATSLMSDRENPDFNNSIKESISAVEAICKIMHGKNGDLSKAIKSIGDKLSLNNQLTQAFINLYNWTNEDGIRHANTNGGSEKTLADARLMLVLCSAFINYLTDLTKNN